MAFAAAFSLIVLYLFFSPTNLPLYELVLFPFPDPRIPDSTAALRELRSSGVQTKEIFFRSRNGRLNGFFFELPGTKRVFLFSHGKGNNIYGQLRKARQYLACGGSVLMYDYQGFGLSQGRPTIAGACEDAVAAYDFLIENEGRSQTDVVAVGESFGSGVAAELSQRRKVAGVIVHSGYCSLMCAGCDTLCWLRLYPKFLFQGLLLDNIAVFSGTHVPLLVIHGRRDSVIQVKHAEELFNTAIEPKQLLLLQGGHCSYGKANEFAVAVKSFLQRNGI